MDASQVSPTYLSDFPGTSDELRQVEELFCRRDKFIRQI